MTESLCKGCNKPMDQAKNLVAYYANNKAIYSYYCMKCHKEHWENFRKENPILFEALLK